MLKKIIARILVAVLLAQCVPAQALADAGDDLLISQKELDRLAAEYTLTPEGDDGYHDGMDYQENFSILQLIGYLTHLKEHEADPLAAMVEMLVSAVAKVRDAGPQEQEAFEKEQEWLRSLDLYMFTLHDTTDDITACLDGLYAALGRIKEGAEDVWNEEDYGFTTRLGYSMRVRKAEQDIAKIRNTVTEKQKNWEDTLHNLEQVIRSDGTVDMQIKTNAANGGDYVYNPNDVEFVSNGGLQGLKDEMKLRNLYKQLRPTGDDSRKLYAVSAQTMGLNRAPSLLERLSPVSSAYADDRVQDATVTVIDDNQFALEVRDESGNPITGMVVRAIDADKMYDKSVKDPKFVEATTDENGAAVFDIPGNFTFNEFDKLELYIEYPTGRAKVVRGAQNGENEADEGYKAAHLWNVSVTRGSSYVFETEKTEDPYLVSVSFDWVDITNTVGDYFHSAQSRADHELFVEMGNADATGKVRLRYTSAVAVKDKDGKDTFPTVETANVALTKTDSGKLTATVKGKFLRDFMPGKTVTLLYEDASHSTPLEFELNLKISESTVTPYKGGMKFLDTSTSTLFNTNIAPGNVDWAGVGVGIDNPFNVPQISVSCSPTGSLFILLGAENPDFFLHGKYKGWPGFKKADKIPPDPEPAMEETAQGEGPARSTEEDAEHASRDKIKDVDVYINKKGKAAEENFDTVTNSESWKSDERKAKLGRLTSYAVDGSVFFFVAGQLQAQGQGKNGTIGTLEGTLGVGLRGAFTVDWSWEWVYGFIGVTVSVSVATVLSTSVTEDVVWRSWSDYDVTSPNLLQSPSDLTFTLYLKLQLELYGGLGMKGVAEFSIHGYAYIAFTLTWTFVKRNSQDVDVLGKPEPHLVISWGGGLYAIIRFIIFRIRIECFPASWEADQPLYNNWTAKSAQQTRAPAPPAPAANAANADGGDEDEAADGEQTVTSDPPVYNSDIVVDIDAKPDPDDPFHFKQLAGNVEVKAQGGRIVYASISGGKYKNENDTAFHTYAFFLSTPDSGVSKGYPRLSYVDLDAPEPQVYTFDDDPYKPHDWKTNTTSGPQNKQEEAKDTRKDDFDQAPYDYDFAVASVADNNKVDLTAPHDGMSAVVCVLSSSKMKEVQETDEATGSTITVEQPSGDFYATTFVATRADAQTGRLSMMVSHSKAPHRIDYDIDVNCSKQTTELWIGSGSLADVFVNPQISAAFTNATLGPDATHQFNANLYEAAVLFQPSGDRPAQGDDSGPMLRYRTYAGEYQNMLNTVDYLYSDSETLAVQRRLGQLKQTFIWLPKENWMKKDANNESVWVADGALKTLSLLPFKIDDSGFKDMWKESHDYGPLAGWIETRGFKDNQNAQLYHFYDTKKKGVVDSFFGSGWYQGIVDWMPLSPADGSKLIGREGAGVSGHITPWNADPDDNVAFFFYTNDEGRSYLDSVNLTTGLMTDYGFTAPAADMGCVDTDQSIIFYWFSSHEPVDLGNGEKGAGFALNTMLYEKGSGVLFSPVAAAHIKAKDEETPVKPFVTENGTCYFAVEEAPPATESGVQNRDGTTTYRFYRFDQKYAMGVEFLAASFADGAVRQGAYDDINIRLRNNGNTPISGFTMQVYNVVDDGGTEEEQWMETIVADLADPTQSSVTYSGLADGSKRTETGADVISVAGASAFRTRGEWAVMEATPTYGSSSGDNPDALPTGWDTESTYVTTNSLLPNDQTTLTAPILIGANWKGSYKIRFRITSIVSSNQWAVDLEDWDVDSNGNAVRSTHAAKNAALRGAAQRQVAVTRMDDGTVALHYADATPRKLTLIEKLTGESEPEQPKNYVTPAELDMMDLDTSVEDVTLSAHPYARPDGTQMVQLTAHNNAHEDGKPKCVLLYAYADYDYENAWLVYDFGNLNAGTSMTLSLPLDLILEGSPTPGATPHKLHLDLHIDHEEARRKGVLLDPGTQTHAHSVNSLLNSCRHDRMALDDVVTLTYGDGLSDLQIIEPPADVNTVTGGEASFWATVMGGVLPYKFEWQVRKPLLNKDGSHKLDKDGKWMYGDWETWPGGTDIKLDLVATAEMNGWQFHVIVTDSHGKTVTSAFATLWLIDVPVTGDKAQPELWAALALAAMLAAMAVAGISRKRRRGKR